VRYSRCHGLLAKKAVGRESVRNESREGELVGQDVQCETVYPERCASARGERASDLIARFEMGTQNKDFSFFCLLFEPGLGLLEATGGRRGSNDVSFWHSRTACYQSGVGFAPVIAPPCRLKAGRVFV
jgi:hypothetical protein